MEYPLGHWLHCLRNTANSVIKTILEFSGPVSWESLSVTAGSAQEEAGEHGEAEQNPHCGETTAPAQTKESGISSPADRSNWKLRF